MSKPGHADVPEFEIQVDANGRPKFAHPALAYAYLRRFAGTLIAGQFFEFRTKRSERQSRGYHAMVKPWLHGEARGGWSIEALKLWALGETFGYLEYTLPKSGEVFRFPAKPHTAQLTVGEFSELIERTLEFAIEEDVMLTPPDEYKRAKATAAKQAERDARKAAKAA